LRFLRATLTLVALLLTISTSLYAPFPAHNPTKTIPDNVSLSSDQWTEIGPTGIGMVQNCCANGQTHDDWGQAPLSGRVNAIVVNSSDTANIYIGTSDGGVWKTTNGGQKWAPITDNEPSLAIGFIAISPDTKTIYVGTGDPNHSGDTYVGAGLLKSTDGGNTWTVLGSSIFTDAAISGILLFASDPNRIVVSTTYANCCQGLIVTQPSSVGLFLSTDGGNTWQQTVGTVNPNEQTVLNWDGFSSLVAHPTNSSIAYSGDFAGNTWETTDMGATWFKILVAPSSVVCLPSQVNGTTPDVGTGCRVQLAVSPNLPNRIFGAWTNSTSDFNGSWSYDTQTRTVYQQRLLPVPPTNHRICGQCDYDLYVAVDPTNANILYVGALDVYRSEDQGLTWTDLGGYKGVIHPDQHGFAFIPGSPSTILVGNDGGIWESSNRGDTWSDLNKGLDTTMFHGIAASRDLVFGGAQDNGCQAHLGSAHSWTMYPWPGDGGWTGIDPTKASFLYCESYHGTYFNSSDAGTSWNRVALKNFGKDTFFAPMALDLSSPGIVYMGGDGLAGSQDYGNTWGLLFQSQSLATAIATSPSRAGVVYLALVDQNGASVDVSLDSGSTWTSIMNAQPGSISSIAVDPNNPTTAYAAYQDRDAGLVKMSYDGTSWTTSAVAGPRGEGINVVKISPDSTTLLVGTDHRVRYSTDGGSSWNTLGLGLPNVVVNTMDIATTVAGHTQSSQLVAGTYGRGAWSFDLGAINLPGFTMSASSSAVTVYTGTNARATITVNYDPRLTGQVTLTTDNTDCSIAPAILTSSGTATLSCNFPTAGTTTVAVTAASANWSHTSTITFTVQNQITPVVNLPYYAIGIIVLLVLANWIIGAIIASLMVIQRRQRTPMPQPSPTGTYQPASPYDNNFRPLQE
jgi:hypothetical protein